MRDRIAFAAMVALAVAPAARADDLPSCQPAVLGTATIQTLLDGRTARLTDGRELRLAGIEIADDSANNARAALDGAMSGRDIVLFKLGAETDRYGRVVALAGPRDAAAIEDTAQNMLLARGLARVAGPIEDAGCAAALLRTEKAARASGLGLWADPHYLIKSAQDPAGILAVRGQFTVVEGEVLSVRESGGTVYVNFGRRWSDDFTVTVPKRRERSFTAAGMPLKKLAGRHVRVRGVVEERGGPWIEATAPGQIEIAERN